MPDFAVLQETGAAPRSISFAGANDPYNLPEYMARDYGMTPDQCAPLPAPSPHDLQRNGYGMRQDPGGPIEWTTPPQNGTTPMRVTTRDPGPIAARPPEPSEDGEPSGRSFYDGANQVSSLASAGIQAMVDPGVGSFAGLGGAIGSALGIPFAGEAAALTQKVADLMKPGEMDALLSNPLGIADNLADMLGMLGIPIPPALKAALGEAKKIADALKQAVPPNGVPGVYAEKQFIARVGMSMTSHGNPLLPGPGAVNVLCLGAPVWRTGIDTHACLMPVVPPHGVGKVAPTQTTVLANAAPVARHAVDQVLEAAGGPNPIVPMTQAERAAEEKRKQEEEERKKREEEERKKREAKDKDRDDDKTDPDAENPDVKKVDWTQEDVKDLVSKSKDDMAKIQDLDKKIDALPEGSKERTRLENQRDQIAARLRDNVDRLRDSKMLGDHDQFWNDWRDSQEGGIQRNSKGDVISNEGLEQRTLDEMRRKYPDDPRISGLSSSDVSKMTPEELAEMKKMYMDTRANRCFADPNLDLVYRDSVYAYGGPGTNAEIERYLSDNPGATSEDIRQHLIDWRREKDYNNVQNKNPKTGQQDQPGDYIQRNRGRGNRTDLLNEITRPPKPLQGTPHRDDPIQV